MSILIILLSVFALGFTLKMLLKAEQLSIRFLARIAMCIMLVVTGVAHFIITEGMVAMFPEVVPYRTELVYLSGLLEILGAIGLLIKRYSKLAGVLLIVFLIMALPANIYAMMHHINIITATNDGPGPASLLFRIPLQVFFIAWIYWSAVRKPT